MVRSLCQQKNCKLSSLLSLTIRVALQNFRQTYKPDMIAWPDFFKLYKISSREQLKNFLILLSDRDNSNGTVNDLPTNPDVLQMITRDVTHKPTKDTTVLLSEINDLCIVVWAVNGRWHWFLGYRNAVQTPPPPPPSFIKGG